MWIEERERNERQKDVEGGRNSHEAFKKMGCSKKQGQLEPFPLNVTQAAGHKARWREEITRKKKLPMVEYYIH